MSKHNKAPQTPELESTKEVTPAELKDAIEMCLGNEHNILLIDLKDIGDKPKKHYDPGQNPENVEFLAISRVHGSDDYEVSDSLPYTGSDKYRLEFAGETVHYQLDAMRYTGVDDWDELDREEGELSQDLMRKWYDFMISKTVTDKRELFRVLGIKTLY